MFIDVPPLIGDKIIPEKGKKQRNLTDEPFVIFGTKKGIFQQGVVMKKARSVFVLCFGFFGFCAVFTLGCRPDHYLRAVAVNGFMLSDTYRREGFTSIRDTRDLGIENLLVRAKSSGCRFAIGLVSIKVSASIVSHAMTSGKTDTLYGSFFYPDALDWFSKRPLRFFREAFRKADSIGIIFIPSVAGVADRGGAAWSDLHPALDSAHPAPDIVVNAYLEPVDWKGETRYSTPFADDGKNGFDGHFKEYLQRIKLEYDEFVLHDAPKVHPASLPCIYLSYDENYAIARDTLTGSMLPLRDNAGKPVHFQPPYESILYTHKVLLLGQNNPFDRRFCDSVCAINGNDISDALRRLYAWSLWKRAKQVHDVFGPLTKLIVSGMMFDPQFGGATPWQTFHRSADRKNHNTYDHVVLSPRDGNGVLDLPGLDSFQKEFVRQRVVLAPWFYSIDRFDGADPPPSLSFDTGARVNRMRYEHAATYRYFKSKGFRFIPVSTLEIPAGDSCFYASNFDALINTARSAMHPEFRGFAEGFIAIMFPCFFDDTSVCPRHEDTCCRCRCGQLPENGYWYNAKGWNDPHQPREYYTLEYMANLADGVWPPVAVVKTAASARPHGKSVVRAVAATVDSALVKAMTGDTVEMYGMTGHGTGVKGRWKDSAARRGITLQMEEH
jgi:hypothetical protein